MKTIDQDDERLKELFFSLKMFIIELNKLVIYARSEVQILGTTKKK